MLQRSAFLRNNSGCAGEVAKANFRGEETDLECQRLEVTGRSKIYEVLIYENKYTMARCHCENSNLPNGELRQRVDDPCMYES